MPGLISSNHLILPNHKNLGNNTITIVCREYTAYNPQELILSDSSQYLAKYYEIFIAGELESQHLIRRTQI